MRLRRSRRSFRPPVVLVLLCALLSAQAAPAADEKAMTGFAAESAAAQRALESRFDALLKKENMREWMRRLSARPHHVGSPYGKANAEFMAGLFKSWGYETAIEQYDVLFPTPTVRVLELVAPQKVAAKIVEPTLKEDSTSGQTAEQLPVYNAYSADGDVTADLVYVNYGVPRDYDDPRGARHRRQRQDRHRALRRLVARHQAEGRGRARRDRMPHLLRSARRRLLRRVMSIRRAPGVPTTAPSAAPSSTCRFSPAILSRPDIGATKDAKRLERSEAPTLMKIPVMPIVVRRCASVVEGAGRPGRAGRVARRASDHVSPGARTGEGAPQAAVRLEARAGLQRDRADARRGAAGRVDHPRQSSRCVGQWREGSGQRHGGRDGGSARDWRAREDRLEAEAHADLRGLGRRGARAARLDRVGRGSRRGAAQARGGLHQLRFERPRLLGRGRLAQPRTLHQSRWRATCRIRRCRTRSRRFRCRCRSARGPHHRAGIDGRFEGSADAQDLRIDALGSGSDYTPFLQHLGVASLNIGFSGEDDGGSYHSIFDSIDHYNRFGDPGYVYGVALAKAGGPRDAAAGRMPTCCRFVRRRWRRRSIAI